MDSAVVLAIAREQGFAVHALSVRYGQRHTSELDAADRVARSARRGRAQDRQRRPAQHRRLGADRRHRRAAGRAGAATAHPGRPTCRRATPSCCRSRWAGPKCWARPTSSAASTRSTIPATPIAAPSSSTAFERLANLATKAGVEGAGIRIHAPLQHMGKADIVREGAAPGRGLRRHRVVLPGRCRRPRLRPLRCLPAARGGLPRPRASADPTRYA